MLSKLKSIAQHSVSRNAAALGIMQIANYAVPLLLLPFLTRQLGLEAFGVVAITLSAIQLAFVFTDYGFSLSATYSISNNRDDIEFINKKISAIFGAKAFILGVLAVTLIIILKTYQSLEIYAHYIAAAFIATAAQAFQPIWLFQGIERMKSITIYTVTTKTLYALLVLVLVEKPDDAVIVIYCWSISQIIGLIASLFLMYKNGYKTEWPTITEIKQEFKSGAEFFLSRLAVAIYTSASTLIVGSHSAVQAAHFAVCEQIYKAGQNATSPINSAMFPYMAKNRDWKVFYKTLFLIGAIISIGCLILSFYAEPFLIFLFGNDYSTAKNILLVFLLTTVINYFCITFGYSAFSALDRVGVANLSVIFGAIIHGATLLIIYTYFEINALSVALSILLTEFIVLFIRVSLFISTKNQSKI